MENRLILWLGGLLPAALIAMSNALPAAGKAPAADADVVQLVLRPDSRLWLEGDSNLHGWTCDARELLPELTVRRPEPTRAPTRVERATLTVPVVGIDCGHSKMNENLRKALGAETHADISFVLTEATILEAHAEGLLGVSARGALTVAGTSRELELTVTGTDTGDGALRVQGLSQILMTDFGVEPPTAIMGLLKTKNEVMIRFDLVLGYAELETRLSER